MLIPDNNVISLNQQFTYRKLELIMMNFFVKAIVLLVYSMPVLSSELSVVEEKNQTTANNVQNTEIIDSLTSISESLDTLAKATIQLSLTSNEIVDHKIKADYRELHYKILQSSKAINEAIAKGSLSNEPPNDYPRLKTRVDNLYQHHDFFTYADFAAIAITSVSVLITIVGLAIAALSFWGYKNIKNTTTKTAEAVAEKVAGDTTEQKIDNVVKCKLEELIDEGKFTKHLEDVVDAFILRNKNDNKSVNWDELDNDINWDEFNAAIDSVEKGDE
ncbi:hypothetical protein ACWXWU_17755 [Shewanella sp. A14]